jgi:apolipoprotein N-acyltransferase
VTTATQDAQAARASARSGPVPAFLLAGGGLIFMTFMRYGLAELGWVVFAPLLAVLYERGTLGRHLAVLATLLAAFLAAVSKMATAEIPYLPDGTMADEYVKRHPVPGDPDEVGRAHARVVAYGGVNYAGAICYDYGFPGIARDNARDGGGLALVPSSDWKGIDPEHGRMALMNAVAVGLPMVRPVRAATSIATDQYGRVLGSVRADGQGNGVMVAAVPGRRVPTVYATTGEIVPLAALSFCLLVLVRVLPRTRLFR